MVKILIKAYCVNAAVWYIADLFKQTLFIWE